LYNDDDDDECVCMLEYYIYIYAFNEDNYKISHTKKNVLMTIWNIREVSGAIWDINRDHIMTKKVHFENVEFVVMRMNSCFMIMHSNYFERELCNQQNFLYYHSIFFFQLHKRCVLLYVESGSC
jgi:hypothetical protein